MFVAFPIHGVLWPHSMNAAIQALVRGGVYRQYGEPWLDRCRSELCGQFRKTNEQEMLFIDADVWFEPSVVDGLLAAKGDMVTATYRKREPPYEFTVKVDPKTAPRRQLDDGRRILEIERDGLGCCLIRRHVIETLCEVHPELAYVSDKGEPRHNLFEYGLFTDPQGVRRAGQEDRAFCERVRAAGFKIECLVDAVVVHGGVVGYFGHELDAPAASLGAGA